MAVTVKKEGLPVQPFEIYFKDHTCGQRIIILEYTNHEIEYRDPNGRYAEICPMCGKPVHVQDLKEFDE